MLEDKPNGFPHQRNGCQRENHSVNLESTFLGHQTLTRKVRQDKARPVVSNCATATHVHPKSWGATEAGLSTEDSSELGVRELRFQSQLCTYSESELFSSFERRVEWR